MAMNFQGNNFHVHLIASSHIQDWEFSKKLSKFYIILIHKQIKNKDFRRPRENQLGQGFPESPLCSAVLEPKSAEAPNQKLVGRYIQVQGSKSV